MADDGRTEFPVLHRPHPWHGVTLGAEAPAVVTAYVEIVPTDTVKYELDKATGYLKVDRPQKFSNICPSLYGFLPRTYCGRQVTAYCMEQTRREGLVGDGDPMDVCVLTEKSIPRGDILLKAIPVGGLRMIDGGEVDDKIVAVLEIDLVHGETREIEDLPRGLVERLRHYFLTYKDVPGAEHRACEITHVYGREEAYEVIRRSQVDYQSRFGA